MAIIVICGVWEVSAVNTRQNISASQLARQYAKDTDQQILEACTVPELSAMQKCVTEKIRASEENRRAAYDLVAQEDVAEWTFWVLVTGIVGTAITGFGLYFLAANLDEMRRQTSVNSIMGEAQVRAYLFWAETEIEWGHTNEFPPRPFVKNIRFKWTNTGNSPAKNIELSSMFEFVPSGTSNLPPKDFAQASVTIRCGKNHLMPQKTLIHEGRIGYKFPFDPIEVADLTQRWKKGETEFLLSSIAVYKDVFGLINIVQSCSVAVERIVDRKNVISFREAGHSTVVEYGLRDYPKSH